MTTIVHSRGVGSQNWTKFGQRNCWMAPLRLECPWHWWKTPMYLVRWLFYQDRRKPRSKGAIHTDPFCQIFSKNSLNGKIASKLFKFEWFGIFKTSEGQENWKKGQKKIWRPNKGQRSKNPNFHNFLDFLRLIGSKNSCGAIFFHFRSHKGQKGHYKAKS